jgi:hypothetical protein
MENFSPDNCFDEMAKVLMPEREPSEVGYIELLEEVKKLKADRDKYFGYLQDKDLECETQRQQKENAWEEIEHKNEKFAEWCVENRELKEENKKLKNDLRLCADGLIPDGMVGGIVECEREKRHKAEEEVKKYKRLASDLKQAIICKVA